MIYLYENENEVIERSFPMGEAPTSIEENGVVFTRKWTAPQINMKFRDSDFAKEETYLAAKMDANPAGPLDPIYHKI